MPSRLHAALIVYQTGGEDVRAAGVVRSLVSVWSILRAFSGAAQVSVPYIEAPLSKRRSGPSCALPGPGAGTSVDGLIKDMGRKLPTRLNKSSIEAALAEYWVGWRHIAILLTLAYGKSRKTRDRGGTKSTSIYQPRWLAPLVRAAGPTLQRCSQSSHQLKGKIQHLANLCLGVDSS